MNETNVEMALSTAAESAVHARIPLSLTFREVYRSNYTYVWRSLLRLGVTEAAVDDAVQDVFIVVHRKLDDFEGRAAVRTWLFAIGRRVAMRYRDRARRNAVEDESKTDRPSDAGRPDEALSRAEALARLQFWLDELDDDKRAVFVLSEFEQLRAPEIADTLGVNLNTVYARLRAARLHVSRRARRYANLENYRPMLRHHSSERKPTAAHRRHAWLALSGKLGLGATVATTTGTGLAAGGLLTKLAIAASLVGGASLAAVAVSSPDPAPVVVASAADVDSDSKRTHAKPAVDMPDATEPEAEHPLMVPPAAPADTAPVEIAPTLQRRLEPVRAAKAGGSKAAAPANPPAPMAADPLAAELGLFEQAKVAARRGDTQRALGLLRDYRHSYPSGTFVIEAAALRVRTLCADGRTDAARKQAEAFVANHPRSELVDANDPCR